jgi:hypothetical protein
MSRTLFQKLSFGYAEEECEERKEAVATISREICKI